MTKIRKEFEHYKQQIQVRIMLRLLAAMDS